MEHRPGGQFENLGVIARRDPGGMARWIGNGVVRDRRCLELEDDVGRLVEGEVEAGGNGDGHGVPNAWQENRFRARPVFSEKPALVDLHNKETQMPGLWFDELSVGQTFDHPIRRTVTETDNLLFTTLSHNPAALHLDAEYMKDSEYGRILVNSCFTLSLPVDMSAPAA